MPRPGARSSTLTETRPAAASNGDGDGSICYPYYPSKEHFCKPAQGAADFRHRLQRPDFIVDQHHRQHRGVWPQRSQQRFHGHATIGRWRDLAQLPALADQAFSGAQNRRVLDGADHHVTSARQGGRAQ